MLHVCYKFWRGTCISVLHFHCTGLGLLSQICISVSMHGRNSLKYDKLEDEYEGESEHYQNEGNVEMREMFFSLGKAYCLLSS